MKTRNIAELIVICALLAATGPAHAAPDRFICAAAEAIACAQDETCVRGSADRVALPLLWRVDLSEKISVSVSEGGAQRTSEILQVIEEEKTLVLFGLDQGYSWSAVIDKTDGKMTLTSSTHDTGYIVHGACSSKIMK